MKYFIKSKLSENIHETPEGYLICLNVPIARTGAMEYGEGETPLECLDGRITITRSEEEVFRPETIASFEGKAVTVTHPSEDVNPDNWSRLSKGMLQNVRRGEGDQANDLLADVLVMDAVAINLVKAGLREVSCGYDADYIQTGPGMGIQTKIVGNHLALVDEGRAGSSYAINDHKGKGLRMKTIGDKIAAIFGKARDEAAKVVDEAAKEDEKKPAPAKDEGTKVWDEMKAAYDAMSKMVADFGGKLDGMKPGAAAPADASAPQNPQTGDPAKVDANDAPGETSPEDRLKALETAVAKLLEMQAGTADEESDEVTDAAEEDDDDGDTDDAAPEDKDDEKKGKTGDAASLNLSEDVVSRIEILAPGLELDAKKDPKFQAIKAAYATADGKKAINALTAGKEPTEAQTEMLFVAVSELLKRDRSGTLSRTKTRDFNSSFNDHAPDSGVMTAEKINEMNAKHYANRA